MSGISDAAVRNEALDAARSFIVQAPAGSGKTELLIQRYLRLLANVTEPEQVLAITFTRKAAAEMRTRVLDALADAQRPVAELPSHRLRTRELAAAVLQHDTALGWSLLEDPNRIRIRTLDSFNTELAQRLPLLSGGIAGAEIADDARQLYAEAARRGVESIWRDPDAAPGVAVVFAELDYSVARLEQFVAEMLAVREQWLNWLLDVDGTIDATHAALEYLRTSAAERCHSLVDADTCNVLERLTRHAHEHAETPMSERTRGIRSEKPFERWYAIASLVLRADGHWRARVDRRDGFGASHKDEKALCLETLAALSERQQLREALVELRELPIESETQDERMLLAATAAVLRLATAELQILFAQRGVADFTELGLKARHALGEVDAPSDLLLALDRRIRHILIDEFQDTSFAQVDLIQTLTDGWEPDDGRTLFLVGDPMQSIYRFRNADMRLFVGARQFGIGAVELTPLNLSQNFRSSPTIVEWVNEIFGRCFPEEDDLTRGRAAYRRSSAARSRVPSDIVRALALDGKALDAEHAAVLDILKAERAAHPQASIAILVRSRGHLEGFQSLLRLHGWQARAVEIDAPAALQLTQDFIGLARALTHFGDRAAWLGLLRAPWCGLRWSELEALVGDDAAASVWEVMHDDSRLIRLDSTARERLFGLRQCLTHAFERRAQLPFVQWLYETWLALRGPETLASDVQLEELDTVLALFERAAVDEDIADVAELERFFSSPARQPDERVSAIEIMTIHRAKGLEFDCVILPGLARPPRAEQRRLVEWCDLTDGSGRRMRVCAPLRMTESATAAWIRRRNRDLSDAETARLMYVAATRARNRLHLIWGLDDGSAPPPNSLLGPLWAELEATPTAEFAGGIEEVTRFVPPLRRLRDALPQQEAQRLASPTAENALPKESVHGEPDWTATTPAQIGIVVHDWLQTICETGADTWDAARVAAQREAIERHLALLGMRATRTGQAADQVLRALQGVLDDPRGRWIIGEREQARSEIMISSVAGNRVVHQRLDRTFVDAGCRWIIDYKTASCEDGDVDAFLDAEVERYRAQLESYALAMSATEHREIRLGLYFPLLPAFREWAAPMARPNLQRRPDR